MRHHDTTRATRVVAVALCAGALLGAPAAPAQNRQVEALLTSATTTTGPLQQPAAETALRAGLPAIARCLRAPFRVGSAELRAELAVGADGRVTRATLDPAPLPRPAMRGCVLGRLRAVRFPAGAAPSSVVAVYEINW